MGLAPIKRMDKPTKAVRTIAKAALHAGLWNATVIKAHDGYYVLTNFAGGPEYVGFFYTVKQAQIHLPRLIKNRDTSPDNPVNKVDWAEMMHNRYGSFSTSRIDDPDFLLRS